MATKSAKSDKRQSQRAYNAHEPTADILKQQLEDLQVRRARVALELVAIDTASESILSSLATLDALPHMDLTDWSSWRLLPAVEVLLTAFPDGLSTQQLTSELQSRNVKTQATNLQATVYSTLYQNDKYEMGEDKKWRKRRVVIKSPHAPSGGADH